MQDLTEPEAPALQSVICIRWGEGSKSNDRICYSNTVALHIINELLIAKEPRIELSIVFRK